MMIRINAIANLLGRVVSGFIGIITVPIYLHNLGAEFYGLISFVAALQGVIAFLDMGLGTAVNKEIAAGVTRSESMGDLVRTFEVVYFGVALAIALFFFAGSGWIAADMIKGSRIPRETISFVVVVAGMNIALRWPIALYNGVFLGLQKHVRLNAVAIFLSIFRNGLSILVILTISNTINAYLASQLFASVVELVVMNRMSWSLVQAGGQNHKAFRSEILKKTWRFGAAITVVSLLAGLLKQFDRIAITNLISLEAAGYYGAAYVIYSSLSYLVTPLVTASFPRFSSMLALGDQGEVARTYHQISQVVSFVTLPAIVFVMLFSPQILGIWTRSPVLVHEASLTLSILAFAYSFNAMMQIPMSVQYAAGLTSIAVALNILGVMFCLPVMYLMVDRFGVAGAGVTWVIFNVCHFLITPQFMHRRLLKGEKTAWFFQDTLPFMGLAALLMGGGWAAARAFGDVAAFVAFCVGGIVYVAITYSLYPAIRSITNSTVRGVCSALRKR